MTTTDNPLEVLGRLGEIEAYCEAATAAPWPLECLTIKAIQRLMRRTHAERPNEDTAFVSHARTDLPALVAACRLMLEALEPLAAKVKNYTRHDPLNDSAPISVVLTLGDIRRAARIVEASRGK